MTAILVTGGAGYIGSHACKALAAAGLRPIVFDNLATGWRDAACFGPLAQGDLLDRSSLAAAFETYRPTAVMHFAALSLVGDSARDPARYWRNNVCGTLNLLEEMTARGVDKIVFSSTAAVYGEPDAALIAETCPTLPRNVYGDTKLAVERLIDGVGRATSLRAMVFRYFNVAGADPDGRIGERHEPETHLVPVVLDALAGRRPAITIHGDDYPTPDGTCIRDYVHVEDLIAAHLLGLERLLAGGGSGTFNLGTGRGYSVREVISEAAAVVGHAPVCAVGPRRPGDPAHLVCDGSRAMHELGWRPQRSDLATMVTDAWRWHRSLVACAS